MTVDRCVCLVRDALDDVIRRVNAGAFSDFNEATIQHHIALNLHLNALFRHGHDLEVSLEKKVRRPEGRLFPKKNSNTANIDLFFIHPDGGARCAVELKIFHRGNHREPNNRCDVYLDLANLEVYLEDHADVGVFVLITDHHHYFENNPRPLSPAAADFDSREGHQYVAGTRLCYVGAAPYGGTQVTLQGTYDFIWCNAPNEARVLILEVRRLENLEH